ncbi:rod shape-determining protein MreC [Pelodictyon luteolum]|uniref:rod shape-determining protein MreC n=1 Tax=Pelodictyon luteolum TaxID=1100 RepID=UPI000ACB06FE|nr:rod shape-determining protein MreC [Pelodictyon luteolum]
MNNSFKIFLRYNSWILVSLLSGISFIITAIEQNDVPSKVAVAGYDLRGYVAEKIQGFGYVLHLKKENDRLLAQNSRLLTKLLVAETALQRQNALLNIHAATPPAMQGFKTARVIDRTFSERENMLLVDKGRNEGIRKDMTVLTPDGLVGRVVSVSAHYASIMPLIHSDFKVSVVSAGTRTTGLVSWDGGRADMANVEHIPISSTLATGEELLTTDFSTFAIAGLPVGRVTSVMPGRLFSMVKMKPAVDFSRLDYVLLAPLNNEPEKLRMLSTPGPGKREPLTQQ